MVSFTTFTAAAVLAFSGMATASPAIYGNGTMSGVAHGSGSASGVAKSTGSMTTPYGSKPTGSTNGTVTGPASDSVYCPKLNRATVTIGGKQYMVECGKTHFGTQISISIGKRAIYNTLGDCVNLCSATTSCVGTAFDLNARTCTLYSDVQAAVDAEGVDFALVVADVAGTGTGSTGTGSTGTGSTGTGSTGTGSTGTGSTGTGSTGTGSTGTGSVGADGATTYSAGQVMTIPVYSTTVKTVLSCAPTVTNCPLRNNGNNAGGVVTELIPVTSTLYTCPAATTVPAAPVACTNCPYQPVTATQYSASSSSGTTTFVPVKTAVVNYPMPSGTQVTVTVCTKCAAATGSSASGTGSGASPTSSMAVYTGAAGQVKAGMGFAAFVAGAAILI